MTECDTYCLEIDSLIGKLLLVSRESQLTHIGFQNGTHPMVRDPKWVEDTNPFTKVREQLDAYFAGDLREFSVPLAPEGTAFQSDVWRALRDIPYGETTSYGEIAERIGNPKASRAVGAANGKNPIPIIVPCHRVIGSTGSMTGFGGGIPIKKKLLALEQKHAGAQMELA
jgi:methylated-DNA-[protein]-cysteine S-methyltransferase